MLRSNHRNLAAISAVAMLMMSAASQASDRSMRCGRYLIYAGGGKDAALMYEVLKKCGEPEAKQGDSWIYVQGNAQRVLTFNYEGKLQLIETQRN